MKKLTNRIVNTFMALCMLLASFGFYPIMEVRAENGVENNTKLEIQSDNTITIDETDTKKLVYKIGNIVVGTVKVKNGNGEYLTPIPNNGRVEFNLSQYNDETYQVVAEVRPSEGYNRQSNYFYGGSSHVFPGDNNVGLDITANDIHSMNFSFEAVNNSDPNQDENQEQENNPPMSQNNGTEILLRKNNNHNYTYLLENENRKVLVKEGETTVGYFKLKVGNDYINAAIENSRIKFDVEDYVNTPYKAYLEFVIGVGYTLDGFYNVNGRQYNTPMNSKLEVNINQNRSYEIDAEIRREEDSDAFPYPILAYFEGEDDPILMDESNNFIIQIPDNWTTGNISFKAKVCTNELGKTIPDVEGVSCTDKRQVEARPMIANGAELNNTIKGENNIIKVLDGFMNYGKITMHMVTVPDEELDATPGSQINRAKFSCIATIESEDLINIEINAPMAMSHSMASNTVDNAIFTTDTEKDLYIFFGNTSAQLKASGPNVTQITDVKGNFEAKINYGIVTITLPDLNVETTTKAELTIELSDGTTVKRTVNIVRTAIILNHSDGNSDDSLYAGYVFNKGYLYNNESHNDEIFDAYLQVILYKDDVVVGFKQIKIDDEDAINNLENDRSGALEIMSENQIPIYGKVTDDLTEGVNGVSVFLTNGPIDFSSDTLPSIEFGIGAGVKIEWGTK